MSLSGLGVGHELLEEVDGDHVERSTVAAAQWGDDDPARIGRPHLDALPMGTDAHLAPCRKPSLRLGIAEPSKLGILAVAASLLLLPRSGSGLIRCSGA